MNIKFLGACLMAAASLAACKSPVTDYSSFVDTKIGSGEHGHVFVGASVPFGMVLLGPVSIPQAWDWCSGYHESDSTCIGFSHTRLSGTGIGDLFDITLMPVVGEVTYARGNEADPTSGAWSYADRSKEVSRPGYYSVPLLRYGVTAEMTATERVGLSRYTFPASDDAAILFDLENGGCYDRPLDCFIETVGDNAVRGWRHSTGWSKNQTVYFYAELSRPFDSFRVVKDGGWYARADYKTADNEKIMVKVGISPVSMEGAKNNIDAELPSWDFDATARAAGQAWDKELSRVRVETDDPSVKRIFYTSLFHSYIHPSLFDDHDGSYHGADSLNHSNPGHHSYTVYSLWDTYRAEMPLLTITQPDRMSDMIANMLDICDQQGKLPVWHLWGCETNTMVGNPGTIAVADAVVKGVKGIDTQKAFDALVKSSRNPEQGQELRWEYGFIPADKLNQSVAQDMENAIADAAIAHAAKAIGNIEAEALYTERSHSYRNYFDSETLFIRGKKSGGSFLEPFNPYFSDHHSSPYTEGNAWQYTWLVPHDLDGLIGLYGSKEKMLERLDALFSASTEVAGENASPDMTGLIGQYVHGNEPSHHIVYLYAMAGVPSKTADLVRQVLYTLYDDTPAGIAGNEDAGQISAWYVLSSMGFYQAEPACKRFWFGSPILDRAELDVPGGTFIMEAKNNSKDNKYIQSVELDGKPYDKGYIDYDDIMRGCTLTFNMGPEPKN